MDDKVSIPSAAAADWRLTPPELACCPDTGVSHPSSSSGGGGSVGKTKTIAINKDSASTATETAPVVFTVDR